jgi:hypothetical protein
MRDLLPVRNDCVLGCNPSFHRILIRKQEKKESFSTFWHLRMNAGRHPPLSANNPADGRNRLESLIPAGLESSFSFLAPMTKRIFSSG